MYKNITKTYDKNAKILLIYTYICYIFPAIFLNWFPVKKYNIKRSENNIQLVIINIIIKCFKNIYNIYV